ncbi:MAG: hypothetical protein ACK5U5_08615, partial [Burkholderiales bacterium]
IFHPWLTISGVTPTVTKTPIKISMGMMGVSTKTAAIKAAVNTETHAKAARVFIKFMNGS